MPDKILPPDNELFFEYCTLFFGCYIFVMLLALVILVLTTIKQIHNYKKRLHHRFLTNEILKSVLGRRTLFVYLNLFPLSRDQQFDSINTL